MPLHSDDLIIDHIERLKSMEDSIKIHGERIDKLDKVAKDISTMKSYVIGGIAAIIAHDIGVIQLIAKFLKIGG